MTLTQSQSDTLVELVRDIARAEILPRFRSLDATQIRSKSSDHDLVTEADLACEAALTARVEAILPGARVVGEESVAADATVLDRLHQPGLTVVIDPVDGTWNFAKGIALFGVILAVVQDGLTIWGLLYDPILDDWVIGAEGQGAWMAGAKRAPQRLRVAEPVATRDATGFVPLYLFHGAHRAQVARVMQEDIGRANSLRCSCHEYRLIAQGHVDFVLSGVLNPWDHAAGVLITQEAGGAAGVLSGGPYKPVQTPGGLVVASGAALRDDLIPRFAPPGSAAD